MGGSDYRPGFDERREVWRLLTFLPPQRRIAFLQECCDAASTAGVKTKVMENGGSVSEVWHDIQLLCYSHGLSLETIGQQLVKRVRNQRGAL